MNIIHVTEIIKTLPRKQNFYCASKETANALLTHLENIGCTWESGHKPTQWNPGANPPYTIELHCSTRITWANGQGYNDPSTLKRVVL